MTMNKKNNNISRKTKETLLYLFFGVCTTLVNISIYYVFTSVFDIHYVSSNILAWIIAVSFAYITNKQFVFHSASERIIDIIQEVVTFFGFRLFTGILDMFIMWTSVDLFNFNDLFMKIISNILVIILNYIFSKFIIFKFKNSLSK